MDRESMEKLNALVGNKPDEAVLEMHFPTATMMFEAPALVSVGGADTEVFVNGDPVPCWHPMLLNENAVLQTRPSAAGSRFYLAIHGGFELEPWLGSYSTHFKAGKGGFGGRALMKDDQLLFRKKISWNEKRMQGPVHLFPWKAPQPDYASERPIRVMQGPQWDWLSDEARSLLFNSEFYVSNHSDRMGFHINGATLSVGQHEDLVSVAVTRGTVQLMPDGQLVILMADHQTTGGYPVPAYVSQIDLCRLAQNRSGYTLRFEFISLEDAAEHWLAEKNAFRQFRNACRFQLEKHAPEAG